MRTCTKCGAQFPDDELICPVCQQEVQLVPDFITIESRYQEEQLKKEEQQRLRKEEREREEEKMRRRNQRKKHIILSCTLTALAVLVIVSAVLIYRNRKITQSYDYQYNLALQSFEEGKYDTALEAVNKALGYKPEDYDARILQAKIYLSRNAISRATNVLNALIRDFPDQREPFELLFELYESQDKTSSIISLMDSCPFEDLLEKYADYRPKAPVIRPEGGTYTDFLEVTIVSDTEGVIYYTEDGREPGENSKVYSGPISLDEEKDYTIKAMLISRVGVKTETVTAQYTVELEEPPAPDITPKSGSYSKRIYEDGTTSSGFYGPDDEDYMITVDVPEGFTCYYSFDKRPTENSTKYTGPVQMRTGEHVFYAVLQGENGKLGKVSSATYLYTEVTPTPTPEPTPYYYYYPIDTQYSEDLSQDTDTTSDSTEDPSDTDGDSSGTDDSQNTSGDTSGGTSQSGDTSGDTSSGDTSSGSQTADSSSGDTGSTSSDTGGQNTTSSSS